MPFFRLQLIALACSTAPRAFATLLGDHGGDEDQSSLQLDDDYGSSPTAADYAATNSETSLSDYSTTTSDYKASTTTTAAPTASPPPAASSSSPADLGPPGFADYTKAADKEMQKAAHAKLPTDKVLTSSPFVCTNENRAMCKEGDKDVTKCVRGGNCDLGVFKEKAEGPWMPCCKKYCMFELLVWFNNVVGPVDEDGNAFWYALNGGTLIGSLRNEDIVDWTTDLDVILPKEYDEYVTNALQDAIKDNDTDPTFKFFVSTSAAQQDTRRLNLENSCATIDVFFAHGYNASDMAEAKEVHKNEGGDQRGAFGTHMELPNKGVPNRSVQESGKGPPCVKYWGDTFPGKWLFPLGKCVIQGKEFPCMAENDKFLEYTYGKTWKEPEAMKPEVKRWPCGEKSLAASSSLVQSVEEASHSQTRQKYAQEFHGERLMNIAY